MGQDSFNPIGMKAEPGKDCDPPACETGMMLLRRWANADPTLARFFPDIPEGATGPQAKTFYDHVNRCPKCNEYYDPRPIPLLTLPLQLSK
jgi:hypothetical protein